MEYKEVKPISRQERILDGEDIKPISRLEYFLKKAAQGSGGGIAYYQVDFHDDKFWHDNEELNYAALKTVMEDQTKFLWLSLNNLVYIPNITVEEPNGAFAFSTTFVRNDGGAEEPKYTPYISRIIINSNEEVGFEEFAVARADEVVGAKIIEVGSAQETFDSKVFPKISISTAKEIYDTYVAGTPVIIRWKVMNAIPVEATVVGSDYVNGTKSFNVIIHDTYAIDYSFTDNASGYTTFKATNLIGVSDAVKQYISDYVNGLIEEEY